MSRLSNIDDCRLRGLLGRWAERFTPDENLRTELVEKTIAEAMASYPLKDDEEPVDVELFRIVRRLALQKFGITEGRVSLDKKGSAEPEAGQ